VEQSPDGFVDGAHDGTVATFDEAKGIGTVAGDEGPSYSFHCTQITDGTRTIAPGTAVSFVVRAGHLGRWEAAAVTPRSST
jgi:CspA family cold shock protein